MSVNNINNLKEELNLIGHQLLKLLDQETIGEGIVEVSKSDHFIINSNESSNRGRNIFKFALGGAIIGGATGVISGSQTSVSIGYAFLGILTGATVGFISDKTVRVRTSMDNSIDFNKGKDYFEIKQKNINLVRNTNKLLEEKWFDQLVTLKKELQEFIKISFLREEEKSSFLEHTYVYKTLNLEQTEYVMQINRLEEDSSFKTNLDLIIDSWKKSIELEIQKTIQNQWQEKYSKISKVP